MPLSRWFANVITTLDTMFPRGFWSMDASARATMVSRAARAVCRRSRCCAELKNVCCVVTRYFGGTLLGPGGLVRAYTAATQAAVAAAQEAGQIVEMTSVVPVDVHVAYPQYEQVLRLAQDSGAKVSDTEYADAVTLHLVFKAGEQESFCAKMRELMAGREEIEVSTPEFAEF